MKKPRSRSGTAGPRSHRVDTRRGMLRYDFVRSSNTSTTYSAIRPCHSMIPIRRSHACVPSASPGISIPAGILPDMAFQRRVAKQIGMKQHSGIAFRVFMAGGRDLKHLSRNDELQRVPCAFFIRTAKQGVKIARHTQVFAQAVAGQIGQTCQGMQRLLPREFVEQTYRHHIRFANTFFLSVYDAKLSRRRSGGDIRITD